MKKAFIFAGLAAATLSFVGCNKEADLAGNGTPFGIVLDMADTRTVNDDMDTKWEENDALTVFYAPAGGTEWSANTRFTVEDPDANRATGEVSLGEGAYDWYLFYPYVRQIPNPTTYNPEGSDYAQSGYTTIGGKAQTQTGNDSKAHLAGPALPLYGVVKNVAADQTPVVSMKQVSSVVAVHITNDTESPLTVNSITFTAPEDIVGTYYIDFSGAAPVVNGSGDRYVYDAVTLTVKDGEPIAPGASAKFYIAVKPFAAQAGDDLKLTVLADQGEVEKTVSLSQACTFASGSIKTLNLSYEAPAVIPTITVADIKEAITSTSNASPDAFTGQLTGAVVSFVSGSNAFIQDETGGILLYQNSHGLQAGDVLSGIVSGTGYVYNGLKEMISLTGFDKAAGEAPEAVSLSLEQLLADYDTYVSVRVKVTGVTVSAAFSSRNTTMTDGDASLALRDQKNGLTITPGSYDIVGYPSYYNAAQFGVWTQDDIVAVASDEKFFGVSQDQFEVQADATSVQVNVTGNVDWTVDPGDGITSVDPAEGSGEGTVTVTFPANTDPENTKEYSLFIRTDEPSLVDAGTEEYEITITQAKADAAGVHTATIDFSEQGYENAQEVASATAGGVTFTFDKGTNNNAPKYYTSGTAVRMYGSNSMTVSAGGKTIISIELGFGSNDGTNVITTDVPAYEEPVWTGESGSVTFTVGGTSGQRRIKTVTVKYNDTDAPVATATLESIAVSGQKTEFSVGDAFTHDTAVVTASYSDGASKDVTASAIFSEPDMTTAGTREVTVSYTEGEITRTTSYEITVTAPVVGGKTLSMTMTQYVEDHECTVSAGSDATMYKLLQLNESVRMSTTGEDNCGSFWNTSSTNTEKQWRLYQNKGGNVIITVAEGCELKTVKLTYAVSSNGILLDEQENQVASDAVKTASGSSVTFTVGNSGSATNGQVRVTAVEVVYTGDGTTFPDNPEPPQPTETETKITMPYNASVYVGETFALGASSNVEEAIITYESEDPAIATVSASGVVTGIADGTVKVYARIAGVEGQYTAAERYCTVTVSTKPVETEGTVVFDMAFLAANKDGSKGVISYTNSSDYGSTSVTELRVYKGKEFVVSASGDYKITGIKMTCTKSGTTKEGPGCWGAGAPEGYTFASDGPVGTWAGSASSVSFTATDNQVRIIELVVTYE